MKMKKSFAPAAQAGGLKAISRWFTAFSVATLWAGMKSLGAAKRKVLWVGIHPFPRARLAEIEKAEKRE